MLLSKRVYFMVALISIGPLYHIVRFMNSLNSEGHQTRIQDTKVAKWGANHFQVASSAEPAITSANAGVPELSSTPSKDANTPRPPRKIEQPPVTRGHNLIDMDASLAWQQEALVHQRLKWDTTRDAICKLEPHRVSTKCATDFKFSNSTLCTEGEACALAGNLTTAHCIDAFGYQGGCRQTCTFQNLYYDPKIKLFTAHTVPSLDPTFPRARVSAMKDPGALGVQVRSHQSVEEFLAYVREHYVGVVVHPRLAAGFSPQYHHNMGHALYTHFYPFFVSLVQFGLHRTPYHTHIHTHRTLSTLSTLSISYHTA